MKYSIEKHIPLPIGREWTHGVMSDLRETLQAMEVGDSFIYNGICQHAYLAAKGLGFIIATKKQKDGGLRVWLKSK